MRFVPSEESHLLPPPLKVIKNGPLINIVHWHFIYRDKYDITAYEYYSTVMMPKAIKDLEHSFKILMGLLL